MAVGPKHEVRLTRESAMRDVPELVEGYRRFLADRYPQEAALYRSLADTGQAPKTMVIACCDSRVDPAVIFSAATPILPK